LWIQKGIKFAEGVVCGVCQKICAGVQRRETNWLGAFTTEGVDLEGGKKRMVEKEPMKRSVTTTSRKSARR